MTYSEPRSICTFCLISAFLRLIRLSFSPTLPSALHYYLSAFDDLSCRSRWIRKLTRFFWLYLRVEYRLFPLRRLWGLFRCRFGLIVHTGLPHFFINFSFGCALARYLASDLNKWFCLLTGFASARPSAFCGRSRTRTCDRLSMKAEAIKWVLYQLSYSPECSYFAFIALNLFLYGF